jgi:hypothetical protein
MQESVCGMPSAVSQPLLLPFLLKAMLWPHPSVSGAREYPACHIIPYSVISYSLVVVLLELY